MRPGSLAGRGSSVEFCFSLILLAYVVRKRGRSARPSSTNLGYGKGQEGLRFARGTSFKEEVL